MSSEVVHEWASTTLKEAAGELFTDGDWVESKDQDPDGEVRLIQLADIGDGSFLNKSARFLTTDKARELRCTLLRPGDLLIARMADPIARCCLFPGLDQPAATVVDVSIVRPGPEVDREYLAYAVSNPVFRSEALGSASGTTRSRISRSNLGAITLPLPPLDEQRRIAEVLQSVDEAIAAAESAVAHAEHALNLNAEKLLVDDLANSANECRLVDLIASLDAGVSVNSEGRPAAVGEIGILKTSCVSAGYFDLNENKVVRHAELGRTRVQPSANSIIISRMNTLDLVGANAFVAEDCPNLYLPDRLWLLKTKPSVICRWLAFYMKTARFRAQIIDIASGTSGSMKNISKGRLADLVLHVPEYPQQELAVDVLLAMESAMLAGRATLRSYRAMRQSLMDDLLSGHVRVPA